jgi:hypothetical protein
MILLELSVYVLQSLWWLAISAKRRMVGRVVVMGDVCENRIDKPMTVRFMDLKTRRKVSSGDLDVRLPTLIIEAPLPLRGSFLSLSEALSTVTIVASMP